MFVPPAHKERKIRQLENVIYSKHIIEFKINEMYVRVNIKFNFNSSIK